MNPQLTELMLRRRIRPPAADDEYLLRLGILKLLAIKATEGQTWHRHRRSRDRRRRADRNAVRRGAIRARTGHPHQQSRCRGFHTLPRNYRRQVGTIDRGEPDGYRAYVPRALATDG